MLLWALRQFVSWQARKVQASMLRPREAQTRAFHRLQSLLHGSDVSRTSGFDACRTLDDCRALPAADSDSLHATLQAVFDHGSPRRKLLGRSSLRGFMRTSGSRGTP